MEYLADLKKFWLTFPGLAEAQRLRDAARVAHEMTRIAGALDRMISELRVARTLAQGR